MQNDITFSLSQLFWLVGGLTAIGAFIKWALSPVHKLDDHEKRIGALETATEQRKETDLFMMESMNAIVNHMIDGNSTAELKRVRDKYQSEIIRHHQ